MKRTGTNMNSLACVNYICFFQKLQIFSRF